jgi:mono/diheme cytochrome c family protein
MLNFFKKRYNTPIEIRNYSTMYLVFSLVLFLATMYSIIDEVTVRRPWKDYQNNYRTLALQKFTAKMEEATAMFDSAGFVEAQKNLIAIEAKQQSDEYTSATAKLEQVKEALLDASRNYTFAKSKGDEAYYFYQTAKHEGTNVESAEKKLRGYEAEMQTYGAIVSRMEATRDSLLKIRDGIDLEVKRAKASTESFFADIAKWKQKIERAEEMTLEIKQVMMNDYERTNFGTLKARVDRCQTCHLGWRETGIMDDAPQPFTSHPFPELLAKHSPEEFGCTTCHQGQGPALDEGFAHSKHHDPKGDHYWEKPLLEAKETYASCQTCHQTDVFLKGAQPYNRARQLLLESGCFGCHEIKGYTDVPKIGPELNQLSLKTNPQWIYRWVRNPKDFNPHTRMPNFKFSDEQAEALTAFLWNIPKENSASQTTVIPKGTFTGGNAEKGKQNVNDLGCKGCHVIEQDERVRNLRGTSYDIAPELTRIGSKVSGDWIYDWIRNPQHFRPDTRMPSLRLSETEAKDIVAYLITLKDGRAMEEKTLELDNPEKIKKGDKLAREYGCNGCHDIRGLEKEGRVSVTLSNFGRKRVDELDFGDTRVHHSWDDWVFGKIKDARQYTTERIISKMPVFAFADSEIVLLRTMLRGMTKDTAEAMYAMKYNVALQSGRKMTVQYNCIGCHSLEGNGGYVKALFEDEGLAPPPITGEGAKVQEMWLHNFLMSPTPIRPWLNLRMPTFGFNEKDINVVTKYFLSVSQKDMEIRNYASVAPDMQLLPTGKQMFEDLQCLSCHYTGAMPEGKEASDLAPNLVLAKNRLKPEWITEWLRNPDLIQPGTRMPQFPYGSALSDYLNGDSLKQMNAIRDYVWSIGK